MPDSEIRNLGRLLMMCLIIGLVAGLGAAVFFVMLEAGSSFCMGYLANYYPAGAGNEKPLYFLEFGSLFERGGIARWMLLIIPPLGGLLSGWITFRFAPEAEGHGTDAAIEAYHFKDGSIRRRVPFIKALTAMITIGSGGSGGREGPIAQIGSGFGSILGRWFKVGPEERRILMAAGMSAGIGAIFHAPLAGALFAAEVLYRGPDLEHEVFVPAFVTSIVAYSVFGSFFGFHPLFITPETYVFNDPRMLLPYLGLGVVSALGAWLFVKMFYGVRGLMFDRLTFIPNTFKPAVGGVVVGIIGFFLPEALGAGYGVIQACFNLDAGITPAIMQLPSADGVTGLLPAAGYITGPALLLALIALAKIGTTSFSIGSGGSGGVFGPAVVIGGAFGGATGLVCQGLFPEMQIHPGAFVLVGMAGFFAGAANTPISTIIMVSEMTGNYNLLVPSMLVCITSYLLCRGFTLYEKQLPSRLDAPSKLGNMASAILRRLRVSQALVQRADSNLSILRGSTSFHQLVKVFTHSRQACFPVVGEDQKLSGVIDADDIRQIVTESAVADLIIAEDIEKPATTVTVNDSLLAAINNLVATGSEELVVVDADDSGEVIGTLSRGDIIAAYNRQIVKSTV